MSNVAVTHTEAFGQFQYPTPPFGECAASQASTGLV